jgi:hypothetical protein
MLCYGPIVWRTTPGTSNSSGAAGSASNCPTCSSGRSDSGSPVILIATGRVGGRFGDRRCVQRRRRMLGLGPRRRATPLLATSSAAVLWTKDSPLRLAFRPPAEETFESPLRSLRPASTYRAAPSGAQPPYTPRDHRVNPLAPALRGADGSKPRGDAGDARSTSPADHSSGSPTQTALAATAVLAERSRVATRRRCYRGGQAARRWAPQMPLPYLTPPRRVVAALDLRIGLRLGLRLGPRFVGACGPEARVYGEAGRFQRSIADAFRDPAWCEVADRRPVRLRSTRRSDCKSIGARG